MKYLVIGIATEDGLLVASDQIELAGPFSQIQAQREIETHMDCEVDRVLIVTVDDDRVPRVINDFNARDLTEYDQKDIGSH